MDTDFEEACVWLDDRGIYAGPHPGHGSRSVVLRRCMFLLDQGIRVFVDLTEPGETGVAGLPLHPYSALAYQAALDRKVLISHERLPLGLGEVPCLSDLLPLLDLVADAVATGRRVYLHGAELDDRVLFIGICCRVRLGGGGDATLSSLEASPGCSLSGKQQHFLNAAGPQLAVCDSSDND